MTRLHRLMFVGYAIALFVATHWPRPFIPGSGFRVDLIIHVFVFGLWNVLLVQTAWLGSRRSTRNLIVSGLVAALAAMGDEFSQALPFIDRTFGFDDMAANFVGVLLAGLLMRFFVAKTGGSPNGTSQIGG